MVGFLVFLSYSLIVSLGKADTQISREGKRINYKDQPAYLKLIPKFVKTINNHNNNEIEAANTLVDSQNNHSDSLDNQDDNGPVKIPIEEKLTDIVQHGVKHDKETLRSVAIKELFGFDFINKTRWSSDVMKLNLQTLTQNEEGRQFMQDLIGLNPCVSNQEGYLALIEHGTKVIENSRPELEEIILNIATIRGERNVSVILRKFANLLDQMEILFPKMQPITFLMQCKSTVDEGLFSMREFSQVFYRWSKKDSNIFSEAIKGQLLKAAYITEVFTNLMDHFQENLSQRDCLTNKNFMGFGIDLVVKTLKDVAEVAGNLAYFPEAKIIRQYVEFTQASMKTLEQMEDFEFPDDCSYGALNRAATHLNDLADVIDEVGLDILAMELGIVFRLDLLP